MATLRRDPYEWPTWITGLLSGESHCEFAAWFRAHYRDYEKRPRDVSLTLWTAEHAAMVQRRADELRRAGYLVYLEDQNGFALKGRAATLGGKADIVAIRPGEALVIDCKSGKPHDKDVWQVLIYMLVLPLAVKHCKGLTLAGQLEYPGLRVDIEPGRLTDNVKATIRSTIERIAAPEPLPAVPSASECRFCDLTVADCKQRIDAQTEEAVATDLW